MSHRRSSLLLMVLVLANACAQPATPTTTSAPANTTTTTQASSLTSEDVALAFFEAWLVQDRTVMEQLSEPAALAQADNLVDLVSESWEPGLCEGAAGTIYCNWTSDAGTLAIGVRNIEEPHLVTSFGLV